MAMTEFTPAFAGQQVNADTALLIAEMVTAIGEAASRDPFAARTLLREVLERLRFNADGSLAAPPRIDQRTLSLRPGVNTSSFCILSIERHRD